MNKFKVVVTHVHVQEVYVHAEDEDHAREIAIEVSDNMEHNWATFVESEWKVKEVEEFTEALEVYSPQQDYLK